MIKRNLEKQELDEIGRKLLEATRISDEEIEQIVAAPRLFQAVQTRINIERRASKSDSRNWRNSNLWNWQSISVAAAILILFAIGAVGFILIGRTLQIDEQAAIVAPLQTESESVEIAPIFEDFSETVETKKIKIKSQPMTKRKAFKKESLRKQNPQHKTPPVKKRPLPENALSSEFYALNYMGNPNDTGEDFRLVRTELSPSALFALGVNVPIENAKEKIKTDLLVGSDGVARAIRFVE